MAIVINGSGTITGVSVGGLPDGVVDEGTLKDALVADYSEVVVTASDSILLGDATGSGNTKRDTVQGILDLVSSTGVGVLVNITYDTATVSGNVDVTGFGFDPTSFIAFGGIGNATKYTYGMGIVGGVDMNVNSRDGTTTMNTGLVSSIIIEVSAGNATRVSSTSSITDGIRLVWLKNGSPTGTANIGIMGFK